MDSRPASVPPNWNKVVAIAACPTDVPEFDSTVGIHWLMK